MSAPDEIETLFDRAIATARRNEPRHDMPADCSVAIEGNTYPLRNLSPTGFLASGYKGALAANDAFTAQISVRDAGFAFEVEAKAVVKRVDEVGLAAKIVVAGRQDRQQIDAYFGHHYPWLAERR